MFTSCNLSVFFTAAEFPRVCCYQRECVIISLPVLQLPGLWCQWQTNHCHNDKRKARRGREKRGLAYALCSTGMQVHAQPNLDASIQDNLESHTPWTFACCGSLRFYVWTVWDFRGQRGTCALKCKARLKPTTYGTCNRGLTVLRPVMACWTLLWHFDNHTI